MGIAVGTDAVVIVPVKIMHPLKNVAVHVIQLPRIRELLPHRMGLFARVGFVPGVIT